MAKSAGKKALIIGVLCIATYLINYYLRNMLSVFSPQLYDTGLFTVSHVGLLSSVYMIFYAAGQLVNGFLGDFLSVSLLRQCRPKNYLRLICCCRNR